MFTLVQPRRIAIPYLCRGMGISLALSVLCARQVAKVTGQEGGSHGALRGIQVLVALPTMFGSALWSQCFVSHDTKLQE